MSYRTAIPEAFLKGILQNHLCHLCDEQKHIWEFFLVSFSSADHSFIVVKVAISFDPWTIPSAVSRSSFNLSWLLWSGTVRCHISFLNTLLLSGWTEIHDSWVSLLWPLKPCSWRQISCLEVVFCLETWDFSNLLFNSSKQNMSGWEVFWFLKNIDWCNQWWLDSLLELFLELIFIERSEWMLNQLQCWIEFRGVFHIP